MSPTGTYTVAHNFTGLNGSQVEGCTPEASLIRDAAGNLYGTTIGGVGCGTVYELDTTETLTTLFSFNRTNGWSPIGGLVRDAAGSLYGTTEFGGALGCNPPHGCGVAFKLDPTGVFTLLRVFSSRDARLPLGGLISDPKGNLYGTTQQGGASDEGTVFKLGTAGQYRILHSFSSADGTYPSGGLLRDGAGNLYGTTLMGGTSNYGTVFKMDPSGNVTVLYNFTGGADGFNPFATLIRDSAGNLYGATPYGGDFTCNPNGCGVVFKISF